VDGVGKLRKEIEEYRYHTSTGNWCEHLADIYNDYYNTNEFDREKAKSLWMPIAYSTINSKDYASSKKAFKKKYKCISKVMYSIKKGNYKRLVQLLQKVESDIFIDRICKELIEVGITPLTIHDSIIIPKNELQKSREVLERVLVEALGFSPTVKTESLRELEFSLKPEVHDIVNYINKHINKRSQ